MGASSTFWTAFVTGLTAPACLFAGSPNYAAHSAFLTPAQSFAIVGVFLNQAASAPDNEPDLDRRAD